MSGESRPARGKLDAWFHISARGSSVRQEVLAGLTTFLAMVYSVIVVPGMLGKAGFSPTAVFVATCLVASFGSLIMGLWANLPMAIGCAISLTAFTAFSLVLGQHISVPVALGAVFLMGLLFTLISVTGIRAWILRNLPMGVAHGTGVGIGLFLLLIAADGIGLVVKNPAQACRCAWSLHLFPGDHGADRAGGDFWSGKTAGTGRHSADHHCDFAAWADFSTGGKVAGAVCHAEPA